MSVGGSTTSLLSFLSLFDYDSYNVDLQLLFTGELENLIPSKVNILPYLFESSSCLQIKRKRSFRSIFLYMFARIVELKRNLNVRHQIMGYDAVRFCRYNTKEYDVAISFIENLPLHYVGRSINAKKKLAWIHTDYKDSKLLPIVDRFCFNKFDKIVSVSEENKRHLDEVFPEFINKSIVIENILSQKYVFKRSLEHAPIILPFNSRKIKLVTICRIDFVSKGLDRAVTALSKLKKQGDISDDFIWYIIGDGPDSEKLEEMISKADLSNYIYLCGGFSNPFPLSKQCDVFFLPSRFEGKPMSVTEAQMLGLLPVVTEYASARSQIKDGLNGIVLENSDDAIYDFLKKCMQSYSEILALKNKVSLYEYSNIQEFKKVEELLSE